jgi:hypothetical protein
MLELKAFSKGLNKFVAMPVAYESIREAKVELESSEYSIRTGKKLVIMGMSPVDGFVPEDVDCFELTDKITGMKHLRALVPCHWLNEYAPMYDAQGRRLEF